MKNHLKSRKRVGEQQYYEIKLVFWGFNLGIQGKNCNFAVILESFRILQTFNINFFFKLLS